MEKPDKILKIGIYENNFAVIENMKDFTKIELIGIVHQISMTVDLLYKIGLSESMKPEGMNEKK